MKKLVIIITGISMLLILYLLATVSPETGSTQNIEDNQAIKDDIPSQNGNSVNIQDYKYTPSTVTVKKGETVIWTNRDSVQHDVSGVGEFKGPLLTSGESFSYTFDTVGTYDYICTPHPYMQGTVIVED